MQNPDQKPNTKPPAASLHPESAEWMDYLYQEISSARKQEMDLHLAACPSCSLQVGKWRASLRSLDQWQLEDAAAAPALPPPPNSSGLAHSGPWPARRSWPFAIKWVAAAALVLGLGFLIGRQSNPWAHDLAALKTSVARLSDALEHEHESNVSNAAAVAGAMAQAQTLHWLAEYSWAECDRNADDQQTLKLTVQDLAGRLIRLQSELETVAANTQDGFLQTHQNLTRIIAYHPPTSEPSPLNR